MTDTHRETDTSWTNTRPAESERWSGTLRLTVFVVMVGTVMSFLDTTVVNVALHSLSGEFRIPLSTAQWIVTAYLLTFSAAVPTSTWAMRRFTPERTYLAALGLFTVASALCGMAATPWELIAARAVQGIGGGLIGPVSRMMLAAAAGPERLPRAMATLGVPLVLAAVGGPLAGGGLVAYGGWRLIFFIDVPIGVVGMLLVRRLVGPRAHGPKPALDVLGLLLVSPGLIGVTYGLCRVGRAGSLDAPSAAIPLCAGAGLIVAFGVRSLRIPSPLLDPRLYRNVAFRAAAQSTLVTGAVVLGEMTVLPLYLQDVHGADPWHTGLLIAPQGVGAATATLLSGRLFERMGSMTVLVGSGVLLAATVPFGFLTATTPYWWLVACLVLRGLGIGLAVVPATTAAFRMLAPAQIGEASTQLNALHHLGGSLGTVMPALALGRVHPASRHHPGFDAHAFDRTYWVFIAVTVLSLAPAAALVAEERKGGWEEDGPPARTIGTQAPPPAGESTASGPAASGRPPASPSGPAAPPGSGGSRS